MKKVVVSILTYNKVAYTKKCLETVIANTDLSKAQIVVSDNGSTDETKDYLKKLGKKIQFVDNNQNLGFSVGHNRIINNFPDNDILLLNNDIEVPPSWLDVLQFKIYDRELGAGAPAIKTKDGLDVGAILDANGGGHSLINSDTEPDWITGSCFYITRDTINKIGMLSEDFKFYYEDVDYCFRMKKAGIKFACIKEVEIIHHNSVSSNPSFKKIMMAESKKKFMEKWLK
jgi:O-antigen biosynthesis protein